MPAEGPAAEPALAAPVWLDRRTPPHIGTLVALSALAALNMNVFLPSLPALAADFGADYARAQLAVSGYLAATAAVQIAIGPLSDRYGRRPVMLWAMAVFLLATVGCLLAPTMEAFLGFRLLQSAVVTGLALSRAVARDVAGPAGAASMIGYVTMGMAIAPALGPMLGGFLDQLYGWRASFVMLLAAGVAILAAAWRDMGETNLHPSETLTAQFRAYPELMRSRRFWGFALVAAFASGAFFAFLGGAPYVGAEVLGMSPAALGAHFGFIALGYAFGNFLSGRYSGRLGVNAMMLAGTLTALSAMLTTLGLFGLGATHPMAFFGPILFLGVGNGLTLPSANAGMLSVRPHLAGSASGLGGALMIGGGAALSAATGALLGPGSGAWPLLYMMTASSAASVAALGYVAWVDRVAGPLPGLETRRADR